MREIGSGRSLSLKGTGCCLGSSCQVTGKASIIITITSLVCALSCMNTHLFKLSLEMPHNRKEMGIAAMNIKRTIECYK